MAVPSYTEDLTDIDLASATTNYVQINHAGGGGGTLGVGPDFSMQGNNCVDRQITNNNRGIAFNNGAGINVVGTDVHVFQWMFVATPGLTDSLQNEGAAVFAGDGTGQLVRFHVEGNDTYGAAGRVGRCYPYRYVLTANASPPYRTLTGAPSGNPQYFGCGIKTTGTVKGANLGCDAMRYGTGAYITAGEVANPGTFDGYATQNDLVANRWGICTKVGPVFELQGKFVIGQNNSKTATLAYWDDTDVSLLIKDTPHSLTDFTQIIIDHASTTCILTNVNIEAEGTHNPGQFIVNSANPTVTITGGTWKNIGIVTFRGNTSATVLTLRNTGIVTQNNALLDTCLFDASTNTHHVLSDNPSDIVDCEFVFSSGHAVRCDTVGTYNWIGNTDSGYTGTRGSNAVSSSGSTDAMFYNNSGGLITLNVSAGGQAPSVRNGSGATTVVNATVSVTLIDLADNTEVTVYLAGTNTLVDEVENVVGNQFIFSDTAGTQVDILIHNVSYYRADYLDFTVPTNPTTVPVSQVFDPNYRNP